jgi:hypothetical protein
VRGAKDRRPVHWILLGLACKIRVRPWCVMTSGGKRRLGMNIGGEMKAKRTVVMMLRVKVKDRGDDEGANAKR